MKEINELFFLPLEPTKISHLILKETDPDINPALIKIIGEIENLISQKRKDKIVSFVLDSLWTKIKELIKNLIQLEDFQNNIKQSGNYCSWKEEEELFSLLCSIEEKISSIISEIEEIIRKNHLTPFLLN